MKILIVEDELVSREKMNRFIQGLGYETLVAKNIIVNDKGTHFDPMVVDAFLSCERRFTEISNRFRAK